LRAWAVGDGQGGSLSDRVGHVVLYDGGWSRALTISLALQCRWNSQILTVGGILADSLSCRDPDRRNPGAVRWSSRGPSGGWR
jgi:hypothetical protein